MTYYYLLFSIFAIVIYMMVVDENVSTAIVYVLKLLNIQIERLKWIILYHPANPINKYLIWRRSWKLAKELQKELDSLSKNERV